MDTATAELIPSFWNEFKSTFNVDLYRDWNHRLPGPRSLVPETVDKKPALALCPDAAVQQIFRITNQINSTYVRFVYATSGYIASYATIQNGAGEAYQISYFDGAGRLRASGGDHPGSSTGYLGNLIRIQ